jgi:hypothetical protein
MDLAAQSLPPLPPFLKVTYVVMGRAAGVMIFGRFLRNFFRQDTKISSGTYCNGLPNTIGAAALIFLNRPWRKL